VPLLEGAAPTCTSRTQQPEVNAMTLNSRIYVHGEIAAQDVFHAMQELLTQYDADKRTPDQQKWTDAQDKTRTVGASTAETGNPWTISNSIGQGLPAWLMVHYRPSEALRPDAEACSDYCDDPDPEDPEPYHSHRPQHWLVVSIDTAYGYKGDDGLGCGDLHALLIGQLGQWLDARGVAWSWQNEFTGDIHGGEDRYHRLIDIASSGFEATAWFQSTALPAIMATQPSRRSPSSHPKPPAGDWYSTLQPPPAYEGERR
jgi:hypothetical protein